MLPNIFVSPHTRQLGGHDRKFYFLQFNIEMNTDMVSLSYSKIRFSEIKSNPGKAHHRKICSQIGNYTKILSAINLRKYFKMKNYVKRMISP